MQPGPQTADMAMASRKPGEGLRAASVSRPRILFAAIGICAAGGVLMAGLLSPAAADWPSLLKYSSLILLLCAAAGIWVTAEAAPPAASAQSGAEPSQERALRVAAALDRDGGAIASAAAELARAEEEMRAHLALAAEASETSAEATRILADRAETLAEAVRTGTAESAWATAVASRMAATAFQVQSSIAAIACRMMEVSQSAEAVGHSLLRDAGLPGAAGQDDAANAASSLAAITQTIDALRAEAEEAYSRLSQLNALTESQHAFAARLEAAAQRQSEQIAALLEDLRATHGGVAGLRAEMEVLTSQQARRDEGVATLRKTAQRLPEYADTVAQLFRDAAEGKQA